MTPLRRITDAASALRLAGLGSALLWAGAAATIVAAVARGAGMRLTEWPVAFLLGLVAIVAFVAAVRRQGPLGSPVQVALWVEQQQPSLRYALIASVDAEQRGLTPAAELCQAADSAEIRQWVRRSRSRAIRSAGLALLVGIGLLLLATRLAPAGAPRAADSVRADPRPSRNRLVPLTARLAPPAYSGLPASALSEPERIAALVGTSVLLVGEGDADGVTLAGRDTVAASDTAAGWQVAFAMPLEPAVITLRDRSYHRLITLAPRIDSVPEVVLHRPAHDTTYRVAPSEPLVLEADATDDLGLAYGYWELLITTGSGEQFETVTRLAGRVAFERRREGRLRYALRLDTLRLTPGSVVNLRAVVFDANTLTGPGRGVSETRTIRLAVVIDSTGVAAEPAIPIDSMWMSQRLLNLRTDTLLLERRRIARTEFGSRSANLSNAQETIRGRVIAVVALLEDDGVGGSAPTEDSRLLREAADAMLEARYRLAVASPDSARPFMRKALAILDQIRTAKRYHLRGVIRPVPVDIATVRLTGTEHAAPAPAGARPRLDLADRLIAERLERAARIGVSDAAAALDSLTFLHAALLRDRADLAAALAGGLTAARQGTPIATAIGPLRRRLSAPPVRVAGPGEWSGGAIP